MVITRQLGVDADLCVVFLAFEVVCVSAGPAPIARVTARISAAVRIPVFCLVVYSDECLEVLAVCFVMKVFVNFFRADGLFENCNILCFSAGLIDGEDPV